MVGTDDEDMEGNSAAGYAELFMVKAAGNTPAAQISVEMSQNDITMSLLDPP